MAANRIYFNHFHLPIAFMKQLLLASWLLFAAALATGQSLYVQTFGDNKSPAIIFLHGGPGYNCASFEATTAQKLEEKGFFVIVYDRRGEGRSTKDKVEYTFQQTFDDINQIFKKYKIKKASLIGHSFGGMVAVLYAEKYPNKINKLYLVGAPVNLQESFKNILASSKKIYQENNNSAQLNYLSLVESMDTATLEYSSACFGHAMQNGFYSPKAPSDECKSIYQSFKSNPLSKLAGKMTYEGPKGFWQNEHYTTLNLAPNIQRLVDKKMNIIGLYGKEDGLYSQNQVEALRKILGTERLFYFDNCSHSVFIDQQEAFLEQITP